MGLFGKKEEYHEPVPQPPPEKHNTIFSRNRTSQDERYPPQQQHTEKSGGLFNRNRTSQDERHAPPPQAEKSGGLFSRNRTSQDERHAPVDPHHGSSPSRGSKLGGLLGRDNEDKSVTAARERVQRAEDAEQRAERALAEARAEVREAKEHARRLEAEAAEDLKRAQKKSDASHDITKRANPLGKFGS